MNILNNTSEVHIAQEIHFFSSFVHDGLWKNLKKEIKISRDKLNIRIFLYVLQKIEHFGVYWENNSDFDEEEITKHFENIKLEKKSIFEYLLRRDFIKNSKKNKSNIKYIGEKTPSNIYHALQILKWFPDSRIIFLYRNPIKVLNSEVNKKSKPDYPLRKNNPFYQYGLVIYVFIVWASSALMALYVKSRYVDNIIFAAYEDLDLYTESTIRQITSKIKVGFKACICQVNKVDSSFENGNNKSYWLAPKFVSFLYTIFLTPLQILLKKTES